MSSPSSSVQQGRLALGTRLREIRVGAGLTARELGGLMGRHGSKLSRIEHGKAVPSTTDIRSWCELCGVPEQVPDLVASLHAVELAYIEWRRLEVGGLRQLQAASLPLYERTKVFRVYQSLVMPGLFQTPGYATALLTKIAAFREIPKDIEAAVAERIERQRVLTSGNHRFTAVIEEAVLYQQIGDREVMAGQLGHLIAMTTLPSMALGIIPSAAEQRSVWALEGFGIFDSSQVNVELLSARVTLTQPREIALYLKAFTELSAIAVYGASARTRITAAIQSFDAT